MRARRGMVSVVCLQAKDLKLGQSIQASYGCMRTSSSSDAAGSPGALLLSPPSNIIIGFRERVWVSRTCISRRTHAWHIGPE